MSGYFSTFNTDVHAITRDVFDGYDLKIDMITQFQRTSNFKVGLSDFDMSELRQCTTHYLPYQHEYSDQIVSMSRL